MDEHNAEVLESYLDKMQRQFLEIEKYNEDVSSHKHKKRLITLTKLQGLNNYHYEEGHQEIGYCEGIEIGKCVYLFGGIGSRWFRTSTVQDIDEDRQLIFTQNSIYHYKWDDTE